MKQKLTDKLSADKEMSAVLADKEMNIEDKWISLGAASKDQKIANAVRGAVEK